MGWAWPSPLGPLIFKIKREIQGDPPPDSTPVSNKASTKSLLETHISAHVNESTTSSTIDMIRQRSNKKNVGNKSENVKEYQQSSICTGSSMTKIKVNVNTRKPKVKESPTETEEEEEEADDENLSPKDYKYRAQMLLRILRQAIENRSNELNSTPIHPHTSYPGFHHFMRNQLLSQTSSTSPYNPYTHQRSPK
ncbi:unnamed protein product [Rotaria sp. Silwood2]|nr:unnamed protein product [Rotaria sp. Silwood2]